MGELLTPDICVIGAGTAGLAVAEIAARHGVSVVLVERDRMGGDRVNRSDVPARALMAAATLAYRSAHAGRLGVDARVRTDFARIRRHVHRAVEVVASNVARERFAGLGIQVVTGMGSFADKATLSVDGSVTIKARRFVIATGSAPAIPPIPGLAETPYLTNETVFDLAELPAHLIIIGGNSTALEFAQAFRRLGAVVTVIEAGRSLAARDPECAAVLLDRLIREGVTIREGATVASARAADGGVELLVRTSGSEEPIGGSHLLVAAGRTPRIEGLGLDRAGVTQRGGTIMVKRNLKTSNARIYAAGDAAGPWLSTPVASYHAAMVVRNALFRFGGKVRYDRVPWVTYTDPELAEIGLSDEAAKKKGYTIRILRWAYRENDRARAEGAMEGHIKAVTDKRGRILGATIVGAHAGELIAPWALAMCEGLKIDAMARFLAPYPTLGEINSRAAATFFSVVPETTKPWLLRWLGTTGRRT